MFSQKTNSGTEFWMGFMKNLSQNSTGLRLYISASNNSKVKISIPLQNYIDSIYVPKDSVKAFIIPFNLGYTPEFDSLVNRAIRITSDFPVSIAAMNLAPATTDASIVLPIANIPKNSTYVTGHPNGNARNSEILLVASEDSTKVSITPTALAGTHAAGVTYFKTLKRGQMYQLGSNGLDLTGTLIKVLSQTKLVVFSGHECSNWPCGACDHQYEQVLPIDVLDTAYCSPPHFGHTKGYLLKIVTLDTAKTTIKVNGINYNNVTRLKPLVLDIKADSGYYLSSTKLFHCYQFMKGGGCNGYITNGYGDPSMLELVSTKYFGEASMFSTVNSTNLRDHFVSIVIKTSSKNSVYLDKTKIDTSEFRIFPYNKNYSYAGIKLSLGQHLVECSDGMLAYSYGLGSYESYLYLAGFSLPNFDLDYKDTVLAYDCKNQKIKMQFKAKSDKILKKYTWYFGDGTIGTGNPVQHLYNSQGVFDVKLVGEDFGGKKDSITRKIKVDWPAFDPVRDKIICGFDTVTFEEKNPFFANFKWQDSSSKRYFRAWDNTKVWVRATDTSGYCKFIDTGIVGKISIFSNILVDTIDNCWKYNLFKFKNSTTITADQIYHKAWVFPWKTDWDVWDTEAHFPMPGKYKVYFDIYTLQVNCKARYTIDIVVNPMPKVYPKLKGEEFCSEKPILFWDSSQIVTGYIQKAKWLFDDNTVIVSDSLKTYKTLVYNPDSALVTRFYRHIAISDMACSDTALNAATVWPKPKVDFTLTTSDTIKCLPSARWTFTSTTKVEQDTFSLLWDAGNGQKSTANSMKNIRYTSPGIYKIKLKAFSPFNCHDSTFKTVEVIPVPKAGFYSPDTAQCFESQSFKFIDTTKGQYLKYQWMLGNNSTSTKSVVDSVKYNSPGLKQVKLKINSLYAGCEDSVVHNVLVLKEPKAGLKVNSDTQCLIGNNFNLQNISVFYQPYQYANLAPGAPTDTNFQQVSLNMLDSGNYAYKLIVKDKEGCVDTATTLLRVIEQPNVSLNINDSVQCFNNNRFVFRTVKQSNETYNWKINNMLLLSGAQDSLVHQSGSPGLHTIRLINQNAGGCKDSLSKVFRLLDPLKADFSINKDSQCFTGHQFYFNDASVALNDVITEWTYFANNLVYTGQANSPGIIYTTDGTKNIRFIIKTEEGCIDSTQKDVVVLPILDGIIIGDSICLYTEANLKTLQTAGNPITKWAWDLGDGNAANTQSVKHTYNNLKNYDVSLTVSDANGCTKVLTLNNGVVVYPLPDPSFTYKETTFGVNQARMVFLPQLDNTSQYYWKFPDGSTHTTDTPSLVVDNLLKGKVSLRITNQFGCKDSSSQDMYLFPNNFNVYIPNTFSPNNDMLNDVFKLEGLSNPIDFKLQILNRWGEELYYSTDASKGWDGTYQGQAVQEGVYVYYASFRYFDGKNYAFTGTVTLMY